MPRAIRRAATIMPEFNDIEDDSQWEDIPAFTDSLDINIDLSNAGGDYQHILSAVEHSYHW